MILSSGLNPVFLGPPLLSLVVGLLLAGLALAKGGRRAEPRLFALVCLWMSLLCPAFISHYFIADTATILIIERCIHFFYVYIPAITLVFFLRVLDRPNRRLTIICFALSFLISLTTPTDLYFQGLHRYSWGMIARGGPSFQVFGLYSFAVIGYGLICLQRRLQVETNPLLVLKFRYILISFSISGVLTMCNIPAINGIDFYPLGNLSFIPLLIMAYGVLKHRLLDVRRMVHHSLAWLVVSSLIVLSNVGIFMWFKARALDWSAGWLLAVIAAWFGLNLLYFLKGQPVINRTFNRSRQGLLQSRFAFLEEIALLKNLDELSAALTRALSRGVGAVRADLYFRRHENSRSYRQTDGTALDLDPSLARFLVRQGGIVERHRLETNPGHGQENQALLVLLEKNEAAYLVPMVQENRLLAIVLMAEKSNGLPLNGDESRYIREVTASGTIALFNSMLYQNVSDLRDRLQQRKIILQQEIRDREKAQRALRTSERQYRLLAENILDVIWIINLDEKRFAYISPSVTRLTGFDPQEAMHLPFDRLLTDDSLARMRQQLQNQNPPATSQQTRPSWVLNIEIELIRKDGTTVWVEINAGALTDPGIPYTAMLGIARDITDRRERLAMQQAKAAAEKASRAKSEFLANMSHELRTPLNHIIGFTELVVDQHFGPLNDSQADYLKDVLLSSRHLLELINDILDLSKVEAGKMELQHEDVALEPLLQSGLTMVKEKSLKHGIRLSLDVQAAPAMIRVDKRKLKQILFNLLSNAVKFTPDGGSVSLSAAERCGANGEGRHVEISVSDSGIGIDAANLERIFQTFEQVESSVSRRYDGTGLGLALTRRLVHLHGGRITAESGGEGRGSRFVFTLPAGRPENEEPQMELLRHG